MGDLQAQIQTARSHGYSDEEIAQYLGKSNPDLGGKIQTALLHGYSTGEILAHLSGPPKVPGMEKLGALPSVKARAPEALQDDSEANNPALFHIGSTPVGTSSLFKGMIGKGLARVGEAISSLPEHHEAQGKEVASRPNTADELMGAGSEMIRGVGEASTPAAIPVIAANPIKGASGLLAGFVGGKGAKGIASVAGAGPGAQNLAEDIGNLLAGGVAYSKAPAGWQPIGNAASDVGAAWEGFKNPPKTPTPSVSPFEVHYALHNPAVGVPLAAAHALTKGRLASALESMRLNQMERMPVEDLQGLPQNRLENLPAHLRQKLPVEQPLGGHDFSPPREPLRVERTPLTADPADLPAIESISDVNVSPEALQSALAGRRARIAAVEASRGAQNKPLRPPLAAMPADIPPTRSMLDRFAEPLSESDIVAARAQLAANLAARQQSNPQSPQNIIERLRKPKVEEALEAAKPESASNVYAEKARAPKVQDIVALLREKGMTKRDWQLMSKGQRQTVANQAGYDFDMPLSIDTIAKVAAGLPE